MNCTECRDRLLEAAPAVLRGTDGPDVAAHLNTCASCRAIAHTLLEQETRLREALDALAPAGVVAVAATAAARESRSRRRRRRWAALAPVAAAAGLVALLLGGGDDLLPPSDAFGPAPPPLVETSAQHVVVYQTSNPDIVVIWLYPNDGSGT